MSASTRRILLAALTCAGALGCGSDPPGHADHEALAFDVEGCVRGDGCTAQGAVSLVESFSPGAHALSLPQGASITAKLVVPDASWRLGHLVIGLRGVGDLDASRVMQVDLTGSPGARFEPVAGLSRIDVEEVDVTPPSGATVTVTATTGAFEIEWVIARWDDPA